MRVSTTVDFYFTRAYHRKHQLALSAFTPIPEIAGELLAVLLSRRDDTEVTV